MSINTLRSSSNPALSALFWLSLAFFLALAALAASLAYLESTTPEASEQEAALNSLSRQFDELEGMTAVQRERLVSAWLTVDEGSVPVVLANHACLVYELSACSEAAMEAAVDRAVEKEIGGVLLAPVRFASASCMTFGGERCPWPYVALNREGAKIHLTRIIDRARALHAEAVSSSSM